MPRPAKGARVWFDESAGFWFVRDGKTKRSTGCRREDRAGADKALAEYIADKYEPVSDSRTDVVRVSDVLMFYAQTVAQDHQSKAAGYAIASLNAWWGDRTISEIKASTCKAYVKHRTSQSIPQAKTVEAKKRKVKEGTVRRELAVLQAALKAYHAENTLKALPIVTLPAMGAARTRFLSRNEAARLLWATRKMADKDGARSIRRFVLLGLYTGTRSGALRSMGWMENTEGGWIDLKKGVLHRRPEGEAETNKRKPSSRIPDRLVGTLRRWREADMNPKPGKDGQTLKPIPFVIHYRGLPVEKQRKTWGQACALAGLDKTVTPHILRHTAVTWMMLAGNDPYDVSSYVGMSVKMLDDVYGHHSPEHQKAIASRIGRR